ncbi:MAG: YihY family inner membrane protein [Lentisphaerae bacterium]|nr:YihY family inner membrane protein [Lentisphaerota bacterium]
MSIGQRLWRFVSESIWEIELNSLSRLKRLGINFVRIIFLVLKGFRENECPLHAASLTYSSLMAIVPILALALAVLRGLGAGEWAEGRLVQTVAAMPQEFQDFVVNLFTYVKNTNFATLGGIGLVLLLWTVVQVLGCVEMSFNRVWGIILSRRLLRKFADYLSIIMVVPVLMVAATTINATLSSPALIQLLHEHLGYVYLLYTRLLSFLPLLATWAAFTFLYKLMPNTRVLTVPAVVSGVIGGSLWVLWQWAYIELQVGISHYNAIYGTLASVPIFLIWLYISWWIVLLGAEIGFALQNYATYRMEQKAHEASTQSRIMLALSILSHAAQAALINVPCFEINAYAHTHRVPVRLIHEVVAALVKANLLVEVADGAGRYVLLKVPSLIRAKDVIAIMLQTGATPRSMGLDQLNPAISHVLGKMDSGTAETLKDFSVADLLQLHSRLSASPRHEPAASREELWQSHPASPTSPKP